MGDFLAVPSWLDHIVAWAQVFGTIAAIIALYGLWKKNDDLIEQNQILVQTQEIFTNQLQLAHHPLFTMLENWIEDQYLYGRFKNIGGYSSIPLLNHQMFTSNPPVIIRDNSNKEDLVLTNEEIIIRIPLPQHGYRSTNNSISMKYENPNLDRTCWQHIRFSNSKMIITSRTISKR